MSQTISRIMLPEFDDEMAKTSALLSQVTSESMSFKPSESLHSVGWNANHLLDIVGWTVPILERPDLDLAPVHGPPLLPSSLTSPEEVVQVYENAVRVARRALVSSTDEQMAESWSLKMKGEVLLTLSKAECIRTWVLNHTVHHRAILSVYLRMFGLEIGSVFGA